MSTASHPGGIVAPVTLLTRDLIVRFGEFRKDSRNHGLEVSTLSVGGRVEAGEPCTDCAPKIRQGRQGQGECRVTLRRCCGRVGEDVRKMRSLGDFGTYVFFSPKKMVMAFA